MDGFHVPLEKFLTSNSSEFMMKFVEAFNKALAACEECLLLTSLTIRRGGGAQQDILRDLGEVTEYRLEWSSITHLAYVKLEIDTDLRRAANKCKLFQKDGFQTALETSVLKGLGFE